jgi:glycosyltransferase involved in cell wall biosynthesis
MHIVIDARAIYWTGIGRYTQNLLREINRIDSQHEFSLLVPRERVTAIGKQLALPLNKFHLVPVESSYYSWREQTVFLRQLHSIKADLWHFTHFNVPLFFQRPYVVTIHDVTRFIFPGQKRQRLLQQIAYELVLARAAARAKAVICVSQSTKRELKELPLALAHRLAVIYEGVDEEFYQSISGASRQKVRMLLETTDPYLLYVGVWMSHKNLRRLLAAFQIVKAKHQDLKLVITGKPVPGYSNVMEYAQQLGIMDEVILPGFVSPELLPALYAEAACFTFPSLHEGFGLPPLEAAACGTPVITSNVTSLPEVMGRAAEFCNPEYMTGLVLAIDRVLSNQARRQALIKLGRQRAKQFSWAQCARQTLELYENIF